MPAVVPADPPLPASLEQLERARAAVEAALEHRHIEPADRLHQLSLLSKGATLAAVRAVMMDLVLWSPDLLTACAEMALELIRTTPATRSGSLDQGIRSALGSYS
ncbi:MAG: hypothetical protein ABJE95_27500 [Byssovorax sp.]